MKCLKVAALNPDISFVFTIKLYPIKDCLKVPCISCILQQLEYCEHLPQNLIILKNKYLKN